MDDVSFTLQQLSEISGFEARTIRSYIARDLLPGPYGMGPKAAYGGEHRDRLNVIRRLRDAHREITLDQIRSLLAQLTPERIAAIAAGEVKLGDFESGPPPVSSALSYLRGLKGLKGPQGLQGLRESPGVAPGARGAGESLRRARGLRVPGATDGALRPGMNTPAPAAASAPERELDGFDYLQIAPEVMDSPPEVAQRPEEEGADSPGARSRTPFEELLGVLGAALAGENIARSVRSETWHCVAITPEVELSVRGELDLEQLALLQRIGDHLRHLLMKGTRK